jgi:hypothetical protein
MAIFFRCACGQDLRASEDEAGGHADCPACGRAAPVPSLEQANHDLGIGPGPLFELPPRLPPREANATAECAALPDPLPAPGSGAAQAPHASPMSVDRLAAEVGVDEDELRQVVKERPLGWRFARAGKDLNPLQRWSAARPAEKHWFECLAYPLRAWPVVVSLALTGAWLITVGVFVLPEEWDMPALWPRLPLLAVVFLWAAYTWAFLRCVFASSTAGEAGLVRWPGADLAQVFGSGLTFFTAFLAGPVVPAVVAVIFWLHAGDLAWVDQLILVELGLVTASWWILAVLAAEEEGWLGAINPAAMARHARRLGWRGWLTVVLAAAAQVVYVWLAVGALEELHRSLIGWAALWLWGLLSLAWMVFLFRWYGLSRYRSAKQAI